MEIKIHQKLSEILELKTIRYCLLAISMIGFLLSFLIMLPLIRDLIIKIVETNILQRELRDIDKWKNILIIFGFCSLTLSFAAIFYITLSLINHNMKGILFEFRILLLQLLFIVLFFIFIYGVRLNNLFIPWGYGGDGIGGYQAAQTIKDNGWALSNSRLAAPFSGHFYDAMTSFTDNIGLLFIKLLCFFSNSIWFSINFGFFLNCIAISFSSYFVLRNLKIDCRIAMPASLTYALSPYFFMRGVGHYFLSMYQFVPLSILLCVWCFIDDDFFILNKSFFKNFKNILALIFCLLIAENGNGYYPFFACFFILVTGLIKSNFKINRKLLPAFFLIFIIGFLFILNLTPHFLYNLANGKNTHITQRAIFETEIYGLKIIQLFLPVNAHGIPILDGLVSKYNSTGFIINENRMASLGLLGSFGCLFLFLSLFIRNYKYDNRKAIFLLSRLNLSGILLATIGGFSSLFALLITPQLRAYDRISIFLLFIGILAVSLFLNAFLQKIPKTGKWIFFFLFYSFALFNIFFQYPFDLVNKRLANVMLSTEPSFTSDAEFIKFIEDTMPKGAMIYQLPFQRYPENGPRNNMDDYRLFTGSLHSKELKWSYGAVRGRYPDQWHQMVDSFPIETKLKVLSIVGFEGIYIDRRAYTSHELSDLEQTLSEILESSCFYSKDEKLSFFDMSKFNRKYRSFYSREELAKMKERLLGLEYIVFGNGFSDLESDGLFNWRWCDKKGTLEVIAQHDLIINLSGTFITQYEEFSTISIKTDSFYENYSANNNGTYFEINLPVKSGRNTVEFSTEDTKKVYAPADPRSMYFNIRNFNYYDELQKLLDSRE
jgi:phosphoglycerol transferase